MRKTMLLDVDSLDFRLSKSVSSEISDVGVKLSFRNSNEFAMVRIYPKGASHFDFSDYHCLEVKIKNMSESRQARVVLRLDDGSAFDKFFTSKKNSFVGSGIVLNPLESGTIKVPFTFNGGRPIYDKAHPKQFDASKVRSIILSVPYIDTEDVTTEMLLSSISVLKTEEVHENHALPFIDKYGQYIQGDWKEKVKDDSEFQLDLAKEEASLKAAPDNWDMYGGWESGPKFEASDSFWTTKYNGKWYFVDPAGNLFLSSGIDVLRHYTDTSYGPRHSDWYAIDPPKNGWMSFTHWNLQRKFGEDDYLLRYYDFILRRMDSWGVNTIGMWGARSLTRNNRKPYILLLFERHNKVPQSKKAAIYDCFHPDYDELLKKAVVNEMKEFSVAYSVNDPMCMGYVIDNELNFEGMVDAVLQEDVSTSYAKSAFFSMIHEKYESLDKICTSYGINVKTWLELSAMTSFPESEAFNEDKKAFRAIWLDKYFSGCKQAIRRLSKDKLFFACAFKELEQPEEAWKAAAKYADVLIANVHVFSVANFSMEKVAKGVDKPLLIGAFSFGCVDRGMQSGGICPVHSQSERARCFKRFLQGALWNPYVVGCHWFQYRDQPLVGRGDGESYEIGFVDVCDRVYQELADASREIAEHMYEYRLNNKLNNDF